MGIQFIKYRSKLRIFGAFLLLVLITYPCNLFAIQKYSTHASKISSKIYNISDFSVAKADSDIQLRKMKKLMLNQKIEIDSFLGKIEKLRDKLGTK